MPDNVSLRLPTVADADAIAALCNAISRRLYDAPDADADEVRHWFTIPNLGLFATERDGILVGYADIRCDDDGARFALDLRVHPDAGEEVAATLLAAAETSARERAKPAALLRAWVAERDREPAAALERAGYRPIRHSFHMLIQLPEELEAPRWPGGITVRRYDQAHDERRVYECEQEAFADHWDFHPRSIEQWRAGTNPDRFDPDLWWLAEAGGELAGICLNAWHVSGDPTLGWVGTLGVRRPWRRRGLGLAFLLHAFADFKRRGATRVGLGVDAENTTGAVRLYERAGMDVVRRNDTYEKRL